MTRRSYTQEQREELSKEIIDSIAMDGLSVKQACKNVDVPEGTFFFWMAENETLSEHYTRARRAIALRDENEIEEALQETRDKKLDPQTAKLIIDAKKWTASKRFSRVYGDKKEVEHKGEVGIKTFLEELEE